MTREHPLRTWRNSQHPRKTLLDLANDVGVTASHLSEIENWNNEPSLDLLVRLHRVTGLETLRYAQHWSMRAPPAVKHKRERA